MALKSKKHKNLNLPLLIFGGAQPKKISPPVCSHSDISELTYNPAENKSFLNEDNNKVGIIYKHLPHPR